MTFLRLFPWLSWVLVVAAVVAAAALFAIRPRPPSHVVSSLIIWRRVLDEARERSWWDRLRWIASLLLTLLITAAIAAAFARPSFRSAVGPGRMLIVLDSSWSMRARTASGATRWELALREAQAVAAAWNQGEIAVATTAEGVTQAPTSDNVLVKRALARLQPNGGEDGGWPQVAGVTAVHVFTDGARERAVPSDVIIHSVFAPAPNVAITAFEVQAAGDLVPISNVFLAIENHAVKSQVVRVTIGRAADVLFDQMIEIGAGETHRESMAVAARGNPRFRAHVSAAENALDIDDDATAWLGTAEPLRVAVVGEGSLAASLLGRDPSISVTTVKSADYAQTKTDLWVLEGWLPEEPPSKPALVIDPPSSTWLGKRGTEEIRPRWSPVGVHPILDGVDTSLVELEEARAVIRQSLRPIAVSEQGTALVAVENTPARRQVVFAFSVGDSNLAATPAFPVLVGNAIDWLGRPLRNLHQQPGPIVLPAGTLRVLAPSGRSVPIAMFEDRVLTTLDAPGLYLVQSHDGQSVIRVTLGDMRRSNLLVSTLAETSSQPALLEAHGRPWWIWTATAALALAVLEWIAWQRRITV